MSFVGSFNEIPGEEYPRVENPLSLPLEVITPPRAPSVEEFNLNRKAFIPDYDCWVYVPDKEDTVFGNPLSMVRDLNVFIYCGNPFTGTKKREEYITLPHLIERTFQWSGIIFHSRCKNLLWESTRLSEKKLIFSAIKAGMHVYQTKEVFSRWDYKPRDNATKKLYNKLQTEFVEEINKEIHLEKL